MQNLQIPYALINGDVPVSPQVAEKGQDFSCPICDDEVVLRRGDIRQPHFAHKPDTGCSGEGVRHKTAKQMIYLMYWRSVYTPMGQIAVYRKCPNCSQYGTYSQIVKGFGCDVKCEVDVGRHRVDVALLRNGKPAYGIEIRDTHPVDDAKWDAFRKLSFPCIEVEAKEVIRLWEYDMNLWRKWIHGLQYPMTLDLKAIRHNLHLFNDRLYRIHCPECDKDVDRQEADGDMQEEVHSEISNEIDRYVPRLLARELSSTLSMQFKKQVQNY